MTLIAQQVCSIDLSIKLSKLGVTKKGVFVWEYVNENCYDAKFIALAMVPSKLYADAIIIYPAFTSNELMELLPACVDVKKDEPFNNYWLHIQKRSMDNIKYIIKYVCDTFGADELSDTGNVCERIFHKTHSEKLPDALAEMLIFLLENKIVPGQYYD